MKTVRVGNLLLSISHIIFFIRFTSFGKCDILTNCIENQDHNSTVPTCQIVNNSNNSTSFHCIEKWKNTIFLERGGDITIDCWANFPIDMDYDGVLPIPNLKLSFDKRIDLSTGDDGDAFISLQNRPSNYGIKLQIIERELAWSGNYIFYNLLNPNDSIMISVFSQKEDLPIFLPLKHEKPLDAYLEDENLIIPCRVTNYNSSVKLYHDFVPVEIDNEYVWYDPRKGFTRVRTSEETFNGEYECIAKWLGASDRIKAIASKIPGESEEDSEELENNQNIEEKGELELKNLTGTISFTKTTNNSFSANCSLPENDVDLETLAFTNIQSKNPTYSRLGRKCLGFEHVCDNLKVGFWEEESPIPVIDEIYTSGLIKCFDSTQQEVIEYFIGTDNELYYDWEKAAEKNALIKVESLKPNQNFTANKEYGFICKFPRYVAAAGSVWWNIKFTNGKFIESLETSTIKFINMQLNITSVSCGISIWNATNWYTSTMDVDVLEEERLPTFVELQDTVFTFKEHDVNQFIRCQVLPEPKVSLLQWYKDDKIEEDLPSFQNSTLALLYFPSVEKVHEGSYTCVATSGQQTSEFVIEVKVDLNLDETNQNSTSNEKSEVDSVVEKSTISLNESSSGNMSVNMEKDSHNSELENQGKNSSFPIHKKLRRRKVKYVLIHTMEEKKCYIDEFDHYSATLAVRMRKLSPKQFAIAKIEIERLMLDIEFPASHENEDDDDNELVHSTAKLVKI